MYISGWMPLPPTICGFAYKGKYPHVVGNVLNTSSDLRKITRNIITFMIISIQSPKSTELSIHFIFYCCISFILLSRLIMISKMYVDPSMYYISYTVHSR